MAEKHRCDICLRDYRNQGSLTRHKRQYHPLNAEANHCCYTCNVIFTHFTDLEYHHKTPRHILNAEKARRELATSPWNDLDEDTRYYTYITEINLPETTKIHPTPRPWQDLVRTNPVEIPLEPMEELPDPRLEPTFKFLTLPGVSIQDEAIESPTAAEPETLEIAQEPQDTSTPLNILNSLADLVTECLENGLEPDNIINSNTDIDTKENQEDIIILDLDDWLTIDSTGITPDPMELQPPTEEEDPLLRLLN